ncbi:30S ribosomal protein S6 [Anaplasmataceae bacterium AB001_6]|nr:30S ribosomal protein S6 [Anaplasmataceae bacterium AB001_6]
MSSKIKDPIRIYEMVFLASNTLGTSGVVNLMEGISDLLKDNGMKILASNNCGLFDLKYSIKRSNRAFYIIFYVENEIHANLLEFERKIKLNAVIIRHLFIKKKCFNPEKDTGTITIGSND